MFKATYIYSVFQYQACVYRTQDQYDKSHIILTEMLQTEDARAILSVECISAIEKFQVIMNSPVRFRSQMIEIIFTYEFTCPFSQKKCFR